MDEIVKDLGEIKSLVKKTLIAKLIELLCLAFLLSLSAGCIVLGMQGLFWPCEGNICVQIEMAGAFALLAGFILLIISAIISIINFK
jgi:hypothetical protein